MAFKTFIAWEGPSEIDGLNITVLIQTGSRNSKTGDMVQTFIIRSDIDPITASRTGGDRSICGDCIHRGQPTNLDKGQAKNRTCYVTLAHAPLGKYKAYKKGRYTYAQGHKEIQALGRGQMVRLGTYGDPSACPSYIWDSLLSESIGHTGYTHGESNCSPSTLMTSADSATDAVNAWSRGERTFRVISSLSDIIKGKEVLCPASEEAGRRVTCERCKLCSGNTIKAKSIAIVAHGTAKNKARSLVNGLQ